MLLNIIFSCICFFCGWFWLLPLLLFSWLLGWWFGRDKIREYRDQIDALKRENKTQSERIVELEKELASSKHELERANEQYNIARSKNADLDIKLRACTEKRTSLESELLTFQNTVISDNTGGAGIDDSLGLYDGASDKDMAVAPESEETGIGAAFSSDNLQIIEGVGPKIEGHLKAANYDTWSKVGSASVEDLQKVLDAAGPRYRVHNPKTWPKQAQLAASGQWSDLVKYQKFLDTGKDDTSSTGDTPSKVEKLYAKHIGFASFKPNDLKIVEGIGPKIDEVLNKAGISTWAELAASSGDKLKEILAAAGDRFRLADPTTWPKQAALAVDGKWAELKKYQDFLDGGRE